MLRWNRFVLATVALVMSSTPCLAEFTTDFDRAVAEGNAAYLKKDYVQAEAALTKALNIAAAVDQNSIDVANACNRLSVVAIAQKKYDKAESFEMRAINIWSNKVGVCPDTALAYKNLAALYLLEDKLTQAENTAQQAVNLSVQANGMESPKTAAACAVLGDIYKHEHRYVEADDAYKKVLQIRRTALGPKHFLVGSVLCSLADLYLTVERYPDADLCAGEALKIYMAIPKISAKDLRAAAALYSSALKGEGKYAEAAENDKLVARLSAPPPAAVSAPAAAGNAGAAAPAQASAMADRTASATSLPPDELYQRLSPSVYKIVCYAPGSKDYHFGSGVLVKDHILVTNFHVVNHWQPGVIYEVMKGSQRCKATVISVDQGHDLALVRCDDISGLPVLMRKSTTLHVGERVYAIGNPKGFENTLSEGLLSGLRVRNGSGQIQFTAPISHGSSGGGLFDAQGRLIGITTALVQDAENINLAMPIDYVLALNPNSTTEWTPGLGSLFTGGAGGAANWQSALINAARAMSGGH